MNRRRFLAATVIAGAAATPLASVASRTSHEVGPLPVPDDGVIRTAFAIGDGVNVIDLAARGRRSRTPQSRGPRARSTCSRLPRRGIPSARAAG
jgi:hypothetical protein